MSRIHRLKYVLSVVALVACVLVSPGVAMAQPRSASELSERMNELYMRAEQAQYDLMSAESSVASADSLMSELDAAIEDTSAVLDSQREALAHMVSEDYKQGGVSLVDIVLGSRSFDEMLSRVTYANKVADEHRRVIDSIRELSGRIMTYRSDLADAIDAHERHVLEREAASVSANAAEAEATTFVASLTDEEMAGVMAYEATQREEAVSASLAVLASMPEEQLVSSFGPEAASVVASLAAAQETASLPEVTSALSAMVPGITEEAYVSEGTGPVYTSEGTGSAYVPEEVIEEIVSSGGAGGYSSEFLARAWSLVGAGYQWSGYNYTGDNATSAFTCSGVVDYALGRDSRSSSPETLYEEVGSNMKTDVSQFEEGDLVFYSYGDRAVGHVGIYVGDGQVLDSIPNGGVAVREVDYMDVVGGGSL